MVNNLKYEGEKIVDFYDLVKKRGRYYIENEKTPFAGIAKFYSRSGILEKESLFRNGELHGETIGYFEDGNIAFEEKYLFGKLHGEYISYDKNGKIVSKEKFKFGESCGLNFIK